MSETKNINEKNKEFSFIEKLTNKLFDPKINYMSSGDNRNVWVQYILILAALITVVTTFGIIYISKRLNNVL